MTFLHHANSALHAGIARAHGSLPLSPVIDTSPAAERVRHIDIARQRETLRALVQIFGIPVPSYSKDAIQVFDPNGIGWKNGMNNRDNEKSNAL